MRQDREKVAKPTHCRERINHTRPPHSQRPRPQIVDAVRSFLRPTTKVSDGSQPPMSFDLFLVLNGWLPFAAPSCSPWAPHGKGCSALKSSCLSSTPRNLPKSLGLGCRRLYRRCGTGRGCLDGL